MPHHHKARPVYELSSIWWQTALGVAFSNSAWSCCRRKRSSLLWPHGCATHLLHLLSDAA